MPFELQDDNEMVAATNTIDSYTFEKKEVENFEQNHSYTNKIIDR